MKKIFLILLIFLFSSFQEQIKEGSERWDIKTLTDASSNKINFLPVASTISKLIQIKPPKTIKNNPQRTSEEFGCYVIQCRVTKYLSEDDGDYHLVLSEVNIPTSITMIGEIPNPECPTVQKSKYFNKIQKVRLQFNSLKVSKDQIQDGIYNIYGVAFFDKKHGQNGLAPNGIEIHPILSITKVQ